MGELYYRHSGRFPAHGPPMMLVAGVLVGGALGFLYGVFIVLVPLIYFNLVMTVAVGLATGYVVAQAARITHVRNMRINIGVALLSAAVLYYFATGAFLMAYFEWREPASELFRPDIMFIEMRHICEHGWWSLGGSGYASSNTPPLTSNVRGFWLLAIWIAEIVTLFIGCIIMAHWTHDDVYCEKTGRWLTAKKTYGPFMHIDNPGQWRAAIDRGDYSMFNQLQLNPVGAVSAYTSRVVVTHAGDPNATHVVKVENVETVTDSNGKPKEKATTVVPQLLIDHETMRLLDELMQTFKAQAQAAREARRRERQAAGRNS